MYNIKITSVINLSILNLLCFREVNWNFGYGKQIIGNNFDEAIFFGESKTVDLIAATGDLHMLNRSTKEHQSKIEFDILPEVFYGPGALIYKHMTDMNICPSQHFVPFIYVVARLHTVSSGLNPMTDWPQVVQSCKDWYI